MERSKWATAMASSNANGANQFSLTELLVFIIMLADFCSILSCDFEMVREVAEQRSPRTELWHTMSVADRKQRWREDRERHNARRFRANVAVAANGLLGGFAVSLLLVRGVVRWKALTTTIPLQDGGAAEETATQSDRGTRRARHGMYEVLVLVCAACVLLSIQSSWIDLRLEWRKETMSALRSNHPWWQSEEGRRMLARSTMSRAELIWIERDPNAFAFRMACVTGAVLYALLGCIVVLELVNRRLQCRTALRSGEGPNDLYSAR